jgi:hypothetical protein
VIGLKLYVVNLETNSRKQQEAARLSDIKRYSHSRYRMLFLLFCRLYLAGVISIYRRVGFVTNFCIHIL